jgi:hypothetical protein
MNSNKVQDSDLPDYVSLQIENPFSMIKEQEILKEEDSPKSTNKPQSRPGLIGWFLAICLAWMFVSHITAESSITEFSYCERLCYMPNWYLASKYLNYATMILSGVAIASVFNLSKFQIFLFSDYSFCKIGFFFLNSDKHNQKELHYSVHTLLLRPSRRFFIYCVQSGDKKKLWQHELPREFYIPHGIERSSELRLLC